MLKTVTEELSYLNGNFNFSKCSVLFSHSHSEVNGEVGGLFSSRKLCLLPLFMAFVKHIKIIVFCEVNVFILQWDICFRPIDTCESVLCYKSESWLWTHLTNSSSRRNVGCYLILGITWVSPESLSSQHKLILRIGLQNSWTRDNSWRGRSCTKFISQVYYFMPSALWR